MTPDTSFHTFLVLEGEGANGKSVALATLEAMLGSENVSHVPLEILGQRFQATPMLNKLANISPEVDQHAKLDEGVIKQFVAGDKMNFDRKGISPVSAKPTARLVVATNHRPPIRDTSLGMWRRMLLMPFLKTIPDAQQDKRLAEKLKAELPGILNWALVGRRRLYAQQGFTKSAVAEQALNDYRSESNPAQQFLNEHCHFDSNVNSLVEKVYGRYVQWARANGHAPINAAAFGKEIRKHFPKATKKRATVGGARPWAYAGLVVDYGDEPNAYPVEVEQQAA